MLMADFFFFSWCSRPLTQIMKTSCQNTPLWTITWVTPRTTTHGSGSRKGWNTRHPIDTRSAPPASQTPISRLSSRHRAQEGCTPQRDSPRPAPGLQWQGSPPSSETGLEDRVEPPAALGGTRHSDCVCAWPMRWTVGNFSIRVEMDGNTNEAGVFFFWRQSTENMELN